jgi:hypothetical protein
MMTAIVRLAHVILNPVGNTMRGETSQAIYEITLREKFAKMNELMGIITFSSGIQTRVSHRSTVDGLEGSRWWFSYIEDL